MIAVASSKVIGLPARLWSSVSTSVRTASGSDRIKTQLSRTTNVFQGYRMIRSLPLAVLTQSQRTPAARISRQTLRGSNILDSSYARLTKPRPELNSDRCSAARGQAKILRLRIRWLCRPGHREPVPVERYVSFDLVVNVFRFVRTALGVHLYGVGEIPTVN